MAGEKLIDSDRCAVVICHFVVDPVKLLKRLDRYVLYLCYI